MNTEKIKLDSIESALADMKAGKMIIVVDDENRENEGDFLMPAEMVTTEAVNFMATIGRGLICNPLSADLAVKFNLPLQVQANTASHGTAFTVTIDAKEKISTGISSPDRAHTIKLLTNCETTDKDFVRPGHIFPLIAKDGGVLERPGHTEAAVDLARMCGFAPVGMICEIMNPDGTMARLPELKELALKHDLKIISIEDLILYRKQTENLISSVESVAMPTKHGEFQLYIFRSEILKQEHMAIVKGESASLKDPSTLVRIHSECFTGDVLGSFRCDCGDQLDMSLAMMEKEGRGLLVYLKQEGRGIGLFNKVRAYQLQDQGMDTVDANLHLGLPVDMRDYAMAHQILRYFEVTSIRLLTNNPHKIEGLKTLGITDVERAPLEADAHQKNAHYLLTKKTRLGHILNHNGFNQ